MAGGPLSVVLRALVRWVVAALARLAAPALPGAAGVDDDDGDASARAPFPAALPEALEDAAVSALVCRVSPETSMAAARLVCRRWRDVVDGAVESVRLPAARESQGSTCAAAALVGRLRSLRRLDATSSSTATLVAALRAARGAGTSAGLRVRLPRNGAEPAAVEELRACPELAPWACGSAPATGNVLLAADDFFTHSRQQYFDKAAILLVRVEPMRGALGVILGRRAQEILPSDAEPPMDGWSLMQQWEWMRGVRTYAGGDVRRTLVVLSREPSGGRPVLPGIWELQPWELLAARHEDWPAPESLCAFVGTCGWGPGQLERELRRGVWDCVAAHTDVIWPASDAGGAPAPYEQIRGVLSGVHGKAD